MTSYMGGCQNYGPFLGPRDNTAPNIQGTQKGTIILTTTHMELKKVVKGVSRAEGSCNPIVTACMPKP